MKAVTAQANSQTNAPHTSHTFNSVCTHARTHQVSHHDDMPGTHISLLNLSGCVHTGLGRDKEWGGRAVQEGVCLCAHLCLNHTVCDLLQVDLSLYVCVFAAVHRLRGACA